MGWPYHSFDCVLFYLGFTKKLSLVLLRFVLLFVIMVSTNIKLIFGQFLDYHLSLPVGEALSSRSQDESISLRSPPLCRTGQQIRGLKSVRGRSMSRGPKHRFPRYSRRPHYGRGPHNTRGPHYGVGPHYNKGLHYSGGTMATLPPAALPLALGRQSLFQRNLAPWETWNE